MNDIHFKYEGHDVLVTLLHDRRGKDQYWVVIDSRPVFFVSQPDTAKRLATRFIDTLTHAHYRVSRQGKITSTASH